VLVVDGTGMESPLPRLLIYMHDGV